MARNRSLTHDQLVFRVGMTCEGCANAVRNVLQKTPGVESVDIDVASQQVTTTGTAAKATVMEAIAKTGKSVVYLE